MSKFKPRSIRLDQRHWLLGVSSALKWMKKPVSEQGATQVARFTIGLQGPHLLREVELLRNHPVGQRLLKDKPELSVAFSENNLATMPEGSFGHAYYQMNNQDDTIPGYLLGGLIYRDGFFDALDIDDDTHWYLERMNFDHDASHLISGYSTDLAGELLNIMFIQGHRQIAPPSRRYMNALGLVSLFARTRLGFREWKRHLDVAYERGVQAAKHFPQPCIPYEELLPKPMAEVREYLGISPLPADWDTSDWCTSDPYANVDPEDRARDAEVASLVDASVTKGLDWRLYMRSDEDRREHSHEIMRRGGSVEDITAVLNLA